MAFAAMHVPWGDSVSLVQQPPCRHRVPQHGSPGAPHAWHSYVHDPLEDMHASNPQTCPVVVQACRVPTQSCVAGSQQPLSHGLDPAQHAFPLAPQVGAALAQAWYALA
jgi:hypothetical protein